MKGKNEMICPSANCISTKGLCYGVCSSIDELLSFGGL